MEAASRAPLEPLSDDGLDMPSAPTPSRKADDALALEPLKDELDPAAILGLSDDLAIPGLEAARAPAPAAAVAPAMAETPDEATALETAVARSIA